MPRSIARMTTRQGWWAYVDVLKNRQPFTTCGALRGGAPDGSTGRLPADWRNVYQTGADYVVYSYQTPIAWHRPADDLWIVPDERYSVTTSRHQSKISTAISQLDHECSFSVLLAIPRKSMGAVTGYDAYRECRRCGKRQPAA